MMEALGYDAVFEGDSLTVLKLRPERAPATTRIDLATAPSSVRHAPTPLAHHALAASMSIIGQKNFRLARRAPAQTRSQTQSHALGQVMESTLTIGKALCGNSAGACQQRQQPRSLHTAQHTYSLLVQEGTHGGHVQLQLPSRMVSRESAAPANPPLHHTRKGASSCSSNTRTASSSTCLADV
jgi:hypothetical protein